MSNWKISRALADELDLALSLVFAESLKDVVPSFGAAIGELSDDWHQQGRKLLEGVAGDFFSVISRLAMPLGHYDLDDYSALTLKLRETSAEEIAGAARAVSEEIELPVDESDEPIVVLENLVRGMRQRLSMRYARDGEAARQLRAECRIAVSITAGGEAHSRFWHWLDRFFYEVYQPWRQTRLEFMESERVRAVAELGQQSGEGVPRLDWLPKLNPLTRPQLLRGVATSGEFDIVFWIEPFGLWDILGYLPGGLLVSFGLPGDTFEAFRQRTNHLAMRLKALSDPTRLTLLRIVRQLEVDNSEIADYLEISQPTVSVHAKTLREAGLITSRREGRRLLHTVDTQELRTLMRELESFLGLPLD